MKRALNGLPTGEPPIEISPEADAAMRELKELFSDPKIQSTASFRCCTEGPTELDVLFESILDDQFGHDPNSEYTQWVRRLYELGLISGLPDEWK
jgi:myo-inositol catabolism protein IolC